MFHTALLTVLLALQGQSDFPKKHLTEKPASTKVVATVNGQEIRASDVEPFLWDWRASETLEDLILYKIVAEEANRLAVKVTDEELDQEYTKQMEVYKQQLPPDKDPVKTLAEQGYPKSRVYMGIRRELMVTRITEREFAPANYVKVSTITVKPASEQADLVAAAITTMSKIYDRLKNGEKWEIALKTVTTDDSIVRANGLIGWRSMQAFPLSVQTELKTLKAGGITKPAQTPYGIQIFRIEAKGDAAKPEELAELRNQFLMSARQELMTKLRAAAKVERFPGK